MRAIDADRLKKSFEANTPIAFQDCVPGIHSVIDLEPTVEAEPVRHGHWKPFDEDEYSCSLCGNIFVTMDGGHPLSNGFKFCPFCGAKMDEEKEE